MRSRAIMSWIWSRSDAIPFPSWIFYFASKWFAVYIAHVCLPSAPHPESRCTDMNKLFLQNRTVFFATPRRPLVLNLWSKLAVLIVPIALLSVQGVKILQALHCQTRPGANDFDMVRGPPYNAQFVGERAAITAFGQPWQESSHLHKLVSAPLHLHPSLSPICRPVAFPDTATIDVPPGSFVNLMPLLLAFCLSEIVATFINTLQGRKNSRHIALSIFQHSLAFAEAETILTNLVAFGNDQYAATPGLVVRKLNASVDLLLICLISTLSHLSTNLLEIVGKRDSSHLVNSAVFGLLYLSVFLWDLARITRAPLDGLFLLRIPTVCMVNMFSWIPHFLLIMAMLACVTIFALTLLVSTLAITPAVADPNMSFAARVTNAYSNLQATTVLATAGVGLGINWHDDFFACLCKNGFALLGAAATTAFLREFKPVNIPTMTWLERRKLAALSRIVAERRVAPLVSDNDLSWRPRSGYSMEQKQQTDREVLTNVLQNRHPLAGDPGARAGRFARVWALNSDVTCLVSAMISSYRRRASDTSTPDLSTATASTSTGIDMAADTYIELRRKIKRRAPRMNEDNVEAKIYKEWASGSLWGDVDDSGDFDQDDQDMTSEVSASVTGDSDTSSDGARTPTQADVDAKRLLDTAHLARLLAPHTATDREEAVMLSAHLQSQGPVTRRRYAGQQTLSDAALVVSGFGSLNNNGGSTRTAEAESQKRLEEFILEQRARTPTNRATGSAQERTDGTAGAGRTWVDGGEGMGEGGPQCVVCQASPRTIMLWPCGCLAICEDCRMGVANNNFTECFCCRTKVERYSRLMVP